MAVCTVTATFTGAEDSVAVVFTGLTTNPPKIFGGDPTVSDGSFPLITLTGVSNTGATANTSGRFTGSVTLVAMD